jgi:hypothetical protein
MLDLVRSYFNCILMIAERLVSGENLVQDKSAARLCANMTDVKVRAGPKSSSNNLACLRLIKSGFGFARAESSCWEYCDLRRVFR